MHLQPNHTECLSGRESRHVCEIRIQCHEHAAVLNREAEDFPIRRSAEADLPDCKSIVTLRSQFGRMPC